MPEDRIHIQFLILLSMPTSTPSSRVLFACGTHFLPSPNLVHPWLASKLLWRILLSTIPSLIKFTSFVLVSQSLHLGCFEHILPILYPYAYNIHQWKYFYDYFYSMKLLNRSIPWLKVMKFSQNLYPFCWFIKSHPFPILDCHFNFRWHFCHSNFLNFCFFLSKLSLFSKIKLLALVKPLTLDSAKSTSQVPHKRLVDLGASP